MEVLIMDNGTLLWVPLPFLFLSVLGINWFWLLLVALVVGLICYVEL